MAQNLAHLLIFVSGLVLVVTAADARLRSPISRLALIPLLFCQACASTISAPSISPDTMVPAHRYQFRDGGHAIFFTLDKTLSPQVSANAETFVFVISGSDCTSMQYFLPQYFNGLEGVSGPIRVFILQKRHIEEKTWGRDAGCGRDFIKADHPSQWIADQSEFIFAQLTLAARQNAAPKRIVIAGISEGGDIVPVLAKIIPGVTHAVIIANGGMNPLDSYRLQEQKEGKANDVGILAALDHRPSDPDAEANYIGGRTWRYWAELGELNHTENLLALTIPIWMTMGDADQSVPVESAMYIRDRFRLEKKSNLTLIIYVGADHSLQRRKYFLITDFWCAFDIMMRDSFGQAISNKH